MIRLPIARRSWPILLIAVLVTSLVWLLHWIPGLLLLITTVLLINFFRDPDRRIPNAMHQTILAPADGRVISIETSPHPDFAGHTRISIFMNIFDVHVNRAPVNGTLRSMQHFPGLFLKADDPRAPGENERMELLFLTEYGRVLVSLVAGLIARRIVCWARPDDILIRGQRFAMIKLGSRVDVHLPAECRILVNPGMRVKAGLTPIAEFPMSDREKS